MNKTKGKFIVLYGINNLGKTTQAKMLVDRLKFIGQAAEYVKYPVYNLTPSGPMINAYLRQGNPYNLSPREVQSLYALNRDQYESILREKLEAGINIIAEDYTGTGIAWGIGNGVDESFMKEINSHLLTEDLAFLFDGERFLNAREQNHAHETNDDLTNQVRWAHLKLRKEYGWIKINANLGINEIHEQLWQYVMNLLNPHVEYHPNYRLKNYLERNSIDETKKIMPENKIETEIKMLIMEKIKAAAKLPGKAYEHDAGYDLYSSDYYSLLPGQKAMISTGIKIAVPQGCVGMVWDKSSTANDGLHTMAGVVDAGFRGEIKVIAINLGQDIYNIAPGQKVAQIVIQPLVRIKAQEGVVTNDTDRGEGMLASSGKF